MGLLNDIRLYLMVALAALFLIVVGMCSSAYESEPDGHASTGVQQGSAATGEANTETDGHSDATAEVKETAQATAETGSNTEATSTDTETAGTENESSTATNAVALSATAAAATTAVVAADGEAKTDDSTTEAAATEATDTAAESTTETAAEAVTETATATAEATMTEIKVEGFELSELASTGEVVPDFGTDLGNLKADMGRFSGRVNEATGMFDKIRETIAK